MDSNYNEDINSLMRKYGKDKGARTYLEEVREFMEEETSSDKQYVDLLVDWLMKPNHDIGITQEDGFAITLISGKYNYCAFRSDNFSMDEKMVGRIVPLLRNEVTARKAALVAKMNAAKEAAKRAKREAAKREAAKKEEEKRNAPMKNMVNGFKNKISSLEIAIYNRNNIIIKKDDEIVALKKRIASLALEIEQVRNENSELAIYKELVEGYMNDAA